MNAVAIPASTEIAVQQPANLLDAIMLAASNPAVDVNKLQQLFSIHKEMVERDAKAQYVQALAEFKANPPAILKAKAVSFGNTHYKHATLDMVSRAIADRLADVGITHRWNLEQSEAGRVRVTCILTHRAGHSEQASLEGPPDSSGSKNAIQGVGSAVTYLQRYTLLAVTGLSTQDMDDHDGRAPAGAVETITQEQADELQTLIEANGRNLPMFKKWASKTCSRTIERLTDIPKTKYAECVAAVKAPK
jgi:hypothetical protein